MSPDVPADLPRYAALPEPMPPGYVLVQEELAIEEAQQRAYDTREAQRDSLLQGEPPEARVDLGLWVVLAVLAVMAGGVVAEARRWGRTRRAELRIIVVRLSWLPHRYGMQSLPSEVDANLVACDDGMWWITGRTTNALATPVSGRAADLQAAMDTAAEALPAWLEMADRDRGAPLRAGGGVYRRADGPSVGNPVSPPPACTKKDGA